MKPFQKNRSPLLFALLIGALVQMFLPLKLMAQSLDWRVHRDQPKIYFLGEVHDNPNGHALRLAHLRKLLEQGKPPVLAMEQFDRENQSALDQALRTCANVDCVISKAATPGWEWDLYKPLVQLALDKKVTLMAANLSNNHVTKVMRGGFSEVFSPELIRQHKLEGLSGSLLTAQTRAIQEGHCNMLPPQAIGPMVQGQIARDVWMANVVNESGNKVIVLIAGNGHIRKDAGVFQWLSQKNQNRTEVHGYVETTDVSDKQWYDHVHQVPDIAREDPCLVFKKTR